MLMSLLLIVCIRGGAQELKFRVADCYQDQQDLAAQKAGRLDGDGKLYAVIKVTSDRDDDDLQSYNFDFHNLQHEKEMRDGELWLFVQYNAKNVTIRREGYKTVRHPLPFTVKSGQTYRMLLSSQAPQVITRILQFKVTDNEGNPFTMDKPVVKVKPEESSDDFEVWENIDAQGSVDRLKELGGYLYEISVPNYKTAVGRVSLLNGDGNHVESVKLTPNFGFLEIEDQNGIAGATVYVNNARVGTVPYKSGRMECRDYQLIITNGDLYKAYNATFTIHQGETTKLSPRLESNFAETTIKVEGNAEIFVNGERKGRGSWSGPLKAGVYNVECRLPNHVTSKKQITIKPNDASTFTIDRPKPIVGSVYVTSSPSGAQIFVDGQNMGLTPTKLDNVLIGSHKITIRLANHKDEDRMITVREGETETVNVKMSDIATMTFKSSPSGADLYIDGSYKGTTPYSEDMPSGDYDIKLIKRNCKTFHKQVHLDGSDPEQTFKLPMQYQLKKQLYIQPTFQLGMGVGLGIGGYVNNINMEADCIYGFLGEKIYWNGIENDSKPREEKLSSIYAGGKMGYGIVAGTRFRITPQLGVGYLYVSGYESTSYAIKGSIGFRGDVALTRHFGLVLVPEYGFPLVKSDVYKKISSASSKVKGWGQGFNVRFGLNIYF